MCDKLCVCDKVVGNKLCVTKLWVTSCVKEAGREEEDGGGGPG